VSPDSPTVTITKLVHGGQGLGDLPDGRKVFVWNALPGEQVRIELIKQKRSYAEAIAVEVITPSPDRINPKETNYLATSPWQMMTYEAENDNKRIIVEELFKQAKVKLPKLAPVIHDERVWQYRNKMEYSFWGDDDGLHLALHRRASHSKDIVSGSALAMPAIDLAANAICAQLSKQNARAGDLKTIIVRCNLKGEVVVALFTKLEKFKQLELPEGVKGMRVYYSEPRSPASVPTKLHYELGDCSLNDTLGGNTLIYDVGSFFQVNPPVFEKALKVIKKSCPKSSVVDMYAGVGSIGLSLGAPHVDLIELDPATAAMARQNVDNSKYSADVIETPSEKALDYIVPDKPVIFDPPRAGLHNKVIERVLEVLSPVIIYLSCNPATQVRDLEKLQSHYKIELFEIYNFFPRTPHIETLAVLRVI
jgi:23S rRNA (uracil1939-C5)-methyltransferase